MSQDQGPRRLPPAPPAVPRPDALDAAGHTLFLEEHGLDETSVTVVDVTRGPDGACAIIRQVWWYDEDEKRWTVDLYDELWLDATHARTVARALLAAADGREDVAK